MLIKNSLSVGIALLQASCLVYGYESLQDTQCKQFRQLAEQPGLKISLGLLNGKITSGEVLEPYLRVENLGSRTLEVPDFARLSGIHVRGSDPRIASELALLRIPESDKCVVPTTFLSPGEVRVFPRSVDRSRVADVATHDSPAWVPFGNYELGIHPFSILMGRLHLKGYYTTVASSVRDYSCLAKDSAAGLAPTAKNSQPRLVHLCRLFVVANVEGEDWLFAGAEDLPLETYQILISMASLTEEASLDGFWKRQAPLRLFPLQGVQSFLVTRSEKPVKASEFAVVLSQGKLFRLADIARSIDQTNPKR